MDCILEAADKGGDEHFADPDYSYSDEKRVALETWERVMFADIKSKSRRDVW